MSDSNLKLTLQNASPIQSLKVDPSTVPPPPSVKVNSDSPQSTNGLLYENNYFNTVKCSSKTAPYIRAYQLDTCLPLGSDSILITEYSCK